MEILGDPSERAVVAMMDRVDVLVQEAHSMVDPVPDVVLEVEDNEAGDLVPGELP